MASPPTGNMGLVLWDQGTDFYDFTQLANNWETVDDHDHTLGKGRRIPSEGLADAAVTEAKIAPGAVTPPKIPDASITQDKLAPNSVGAVQIIDGSVGSAELANGSVTNDKLASPPVLGEVMMWYRLSPATPLPSGVWEVMDGRAWSSITNDLGYSTGTIPDMSGKFPVGAGLINNGSLPSQNPDIGQAGGSHTADLSHSHAVNAHSHAIGAHSHTIPTHSHPITTDGGHSHTWQGGLSVHTRRNAFVTGDSASNPLVFNEATTNGGDGVADGVPRIASLQSLYIAGYNAASNGGTYDALANMDSNGAHNHGSATGNANLTVSSEALNTASTATATNTQLSVLDKRPAYVGLLFLMRVRNG